MTGALNSQPEILHDSIRLVLGLHRLLGPGGDANGDEADAVREQLADLWDRLDGDPRALVRGLAVDLAGVRRAVASADGRASEKRPSREVAQAIRDAYDTGQWPRLLELARRAEDGLPGDRRAYLQGRAWTRLGFPSVAAILFEHAARLAPVNTNYLIAAFDALIASGRMDLALAQAENFLTDPSNPPYLLFRSADVLVRLALTLPENSAMPLFLRASQAILGALERQRIASPGTRLKSIEIGATVDLALCYLHMGKRQDAREVYLSALALDPSNATLLAACGLLALDEGDRAALPYLEAAVAHGTRLASPFAILAHRALTRGDFEDCQRLAVSALERTQISTLRASLLEWIAISRFELGASPEVVRRLFDDAAAQYPVGVQIDVNRNIFERRVTSEHSGPWELPPRLELQVNDAAFLQLAA